MLFNSIEFLLFFCIVLVTFSLAPQKLRVALLVVASYVFYAFWRWPYVFLMGAVTLANYAGARWIGCTPSRPQRRAILALTVGLTLAGLLVFKYAEFAWRWVAPLVRGPGWAAGLFHNMVLPIGISFYTLQSIGYVIDVYRRDIQPERSLLRFALFVSFFPQLVAGPIERAGHLLSQFRERMVIDLSRVEGSLSLILWGLFKKVVIADRLAGYVDGVYAQPGLHSGPTLLLATYFFAFQIYCDFSGYSDMAIGTARMLGIDIMRNFRTPYFATSLRDFWRRWHISLSTWFRDYVYRPLGGSQRGAAVWMGSVLAVFLLSGLWHGANTTFIAWGAYHGCLYLSERMLSRTRVARGLGLAGRFAWVRRAGTFHAVLLGWVLFRSRSMADAGEVLRRIFLGEGHRLYLGASQWTMTLSLGLIALLLAVQGWQYSRERHGQVATVSMPLRWASMILLVIGISILGITDHAFIYFQF